MPHRIRLRDPWEVAVTTAGADHSRAFGRPRQHDPHEQVWLVGEGTLGPATVRLNDEVLGEIPAGTTGFAFAVTQMLQARNRVVLELPSIDPDSRGEIALEIRES